MNSGELTMSDMFEKFKQEQVGVFKYIKMVKWRI